jgi:hypothetical protein
MRIGVGLVLLVDLLIRSLSIKAFFTDDGVLPLAILKTYNWNPYYFSLHTISGDLWWQVLLFVINAGCILLLIRGYRTRLFTFICWVFLTSLQNRNPFILQGGDDLLRLILLWGIFLPWGERYAGKERSSYSNDFFSFANVGYILLIASVYFFSALLKTHSEWHSEGTALYYALSLDQLRMPLGSVLYRFPMLMQGLTHVVFYLELVAPLLIVLPVTNYRIRLSGIIAIALLHIGIAGTLYVGLFYIIGLVTLLGMLPSPVMDKLEAKFIRHTPVMLEEEEEKRISFIKETITSLYNGLVILIACYCLMLNLGNVKKFPYVLDPHLIKFGNTLRLEQSWGMFSPSVYKDDGFYIYCGYTKKGDYIDLKRGGQHVSYAKPTSIVSEFESDRWRKFGENYLFNNNNYMRPYFCNYVLKTWNKQHPDKQVSELAILFMKEESLPDYQTKALEKNALCNCHDQSP